MRTGTVAKIAALCALGLSFLSSSYAADTIKIGAIFGVTGPAAYLGAPEEKTARMVVDDINKSGGILGRQVQLIVKDSGASAEKAISFAKQLIDEDNVVAIIGPTTSGESMAIKDLCQKAGMPLISCASAETITTPVAKYVFKVPPKDNYIAEWIYQTMNTMGISKIGVIAANTGFGNGGKAQLEKYASKYGITIAVSEVYDADATDLTALLTKVNAAGVQAVVNWSIEPAQSIVAKNMNQLKMSQQLFQSHGFANIKYVEAAGEAAEGIIFPCARLIIADQLPDSNPPKEAPDEVQCRLQGDVQGGREHFRRPRLRRPYHSQGGDRVREEHGRGQDRRGDRGPQRTSPAPAGSSTSPPTTTTACRWTGSSWSP